MRLRNHAGESGNCHNDVVVGPASRSRQEETAEPAGSLNSAMSNTDSGSNPNTRTSKQRGNMATSAQIGKSIHVKGSITSDEPLTIAGSVEGSVSINGHELTITSDGTVNADITAETILVEGRAKGSLRAATRLILKSGSTVSGELHAPTLSIAEGASIQGKVDAGGRKAAAKSVTAA
jgi:cytoskeletal protein CcmA (bactofilin family)